MTRGLDIGVFGIRGIPSTYGGYETFLTVLLPELVGRGHRVTIYCRRGHADQGDYAGVHRVILPDIASKQLSTLSHGLVAVAVARWARHDVLLSMNVANAPFCLAARLTGCGVVLNTDGQEWLRGKWGRAARRYFWCSAKAAKYSASALVSDSVAMMNVYREQFGAPSTVIPYCWTELDPEPDAGVLDRLGVARRRYFLVSGRLVPENNIDLVVDSYLASGARIPIVVLGRANYGSPVERRLRELGKRNPNIIVAGHVENRASYATIVNEAKGYIHAHSVGGINPALIEAMGCGARILSLSTPFNREALGEAGSYFDDFVQLARLLSHVEAEGSNTGDLHRERARTRARTQFCRLRVAEAYEALLCEVASRPARHNVVVPTRWSAV